jgi:hypothetical protein
MGPEDKQTTEPAAPDQPPAPHVAHHMAVNEVEPLRALPEEDARHAPEPEFEPGPSFGTGV